MTQRRADLALLLAALIGFWQVMFWLLGDWALTPPVATAKAAASLLATGRFWQHAAQTGLALGYALLIAFLGGLAIGVALGAHRLSGAVAEPILVALYSLPKITFYPLILLLFGLGLSAKVAFGAIHGIIPIVIFAMSAVRNIKPVHLRTARMLRLSPWATASTVLVPAALPEIMTGLRVGFTLTLLGVMIGEMFASQRGLGFMIMSAIGQHDVRTIMAVALLLASFAVAANGTMLAIEGRLYRRAA